MTTFSPPQRALPGTALTYTAQEAADLLGSSYDWLTREARKGRLPHHRFGRVYRFTQDDVDAILALTAVVPIVHAPPASGLSPRSAARLARGDL